MLKVNDKNVNMQCEDKILHMHSINTISTAVKKHSYFWIFKKVTSSSYRLTVSYFFFALSTE